MWRRNLPFELTALLCARDTIGLQEEAGNRGPAIEVIQRAANIGLGSPWCAAFVNWCAEYASVVHNKKSPLEDVPHQGFVQSYHNWARNESRLITIEDAYPGSLFLKWVPSKRRWGHIGFVSEPNHRGRSFVTIEGNSNDTGSSEGIAVVTLRRELDDGTFVFIDWGPR
jgi:hypothetical protein